MHLEMDFSSKIVFYFLTCSSIVSFTVEACHNAQHVAPTSKLEISGRKRRSVVCANCTADVDEKLSLFFTNCMERKHPGEFSSWRSVVDFVIRDTNWYHATDTDFCSGRKDSAKCWQRRAQYLLQHGSVLVNSTTECIADFDRSVKDEYGADFEAYYVKYYDSYDYVLSDGEFKRTKRSISDAAGFDVTKSVAAVTQVDLATEIAQSCPLYNTGLYGQCLQTNFNVLEANLLPEYPSLQFFDVTSNDQFVQRHYSSCRITTGYINGQVSYRENCPISPSAVTSLGMQYAHVDITSPSSCIIFDYLEIVNRFSPVYSIYSTCERQAVDEQSTTPSVVSPTTLGAVTLTSTSITTSYPVNTEYLYNNFGVKQRVGSCNKGGKWSSYYNYDLPDGEGDIETLKNLRNMFGDQICRNPMAVEARVQTGSHSGDTVSLSPADGLRCYNGMQRGGQCADYKIRFCCNMRQPECNGNNAWTEWLDRDRPLRGEDESLQKHLDDGNACVLPASIRARVKNSRRPYWRGRNVLRISPMYGLTCKRKDQIKRRACKNYEVSFCCPV